MQGWALQDARGRTTGAGFPRMGLAALGLLALVGLMVLLGGWRAPWTSPSSQGPTTTAGQAAFPLTGVLRAPAGAELVADRTTSRSVTYLQRDGSYLARMFAEPVLYRADGQWKPIDNSLVPADGGGLRNAANRYDVALPATLGSGAVRVSRGEAWASFALRGAGGDRAVARGNAARYANVLPGTAATYTANADSVQELLTLRGQGAPSSFEYRLNLSAGLTPKHLAGGGVLFVDAKGRSSMGIEPTVAWAQRDPERRVALREQLVRDGDGWLLRLSLDRAWLKRELAHGAVLVDPTVTLTGASADCFLQSDLPTTSSCTASTLQVGYNGSNDRRALVKHDTSSIPRSAVVLNAALKLNISSRSTSTTKSVGVYQLLRNWTTATTWNRYDVSNNWASAGAGGSGTDTAASPAYTQVVGAANGVVSWYPTKLVQSWVEGSQSNYGVLVRDVNPNTTNNRLTISSSEAGSNKPILEVVYEPRTGELEGYGFHAERLSDRMESKVNVANGNLLVHTTDVTINGVGIDFAYDRFFNSLTSNAGDMGANGRGQTSTIGRDVRLRSFADGSVAFYRGDGVALPFIKNSGGTFDSPPFLNADLVLNGGGTYTLTFKRTQVKFTFSSAGRLTKIADQNGNDLDLTYTASGGLDEVVDTENRTITFTNNNTTDNFIATMTDSAGSPHTWTYAYGGASSKQPTTVTNPSTHVETFAYDANDRLSTITSPQGRVTKITYDAQGRVATLIRTTNSSNTTGPTTSFAYNDATGSTHCTNAGFTGSLNTVVTDPRGKKTTYCFDRQDRVVWTRDDDGRERGSTYVDNGDVATYRPAGASAAEATLGYDTNNSLTSITQATGAGGGAANTLSTTIAYDAVPVGCSPPAWTTQYPGTISDPQHHDTKYEYDCNGNTKKVRDVGSGAEVVFGTYDAKGNPADSKDANGNTTDYDYDADGHLVNIAPPAPLGDTDIEWDSLSRVRRVTDGKNQVTEYEYDSSGRLDLVTYHDGSTVELSWDRNGNLLTREDTTSGVLKTTSYTYDKLNRLTREDFPGGAFNAYTYDLSSNLTSMQDGGGTVTYTQDDTNLLSALQEPGAANSFAFGYNTRAMRTTTTFPNGVQQTTEYDFAGRTTSIHSVGPSSNVIADLDYSYVKASEQTELLQTATDNVTGNVTTYSYDTLNRLKIAETKNGATAVRKYEYAYDANGNIITREITVGAGSPVRTSYAYNAANQMCWSYTGTASSICATVPSGATTYTYDANGNQTASSGGFSAAYNARNQTTSLMGTSLGYLSMGQTELVSEGSTTYQNNVLGLGSRTASGSTDYLTRDDTGVPLAKRGSSATSYLQLDQLGSIVATSNGSGALAASYAYEPYGESIGTAPVPLGFASGHRLSSGLYHYGARHYNPADQRWTQQDPLGQPYDLKQVDRYTYAGGNPISATDPTGTSLVSELTESVMKAIHVADKGRARVVPLGIFVLAAEQYTASRCQDWQAPYSSVCARPFEWLR